jgi:hypothetical protein
MSENMTWNEKVKFYRGTHRNTDIMPKAGGPF